MFQLLIPGKGPPVREEQSLAIALRWADKMQGYVIDDRNGVGLDQRADGRWNLDISGEVTGRCWEVDYWTTEELVAYYPTMKAGTIDGYTYSCPQCGAGPEHYWPLMRSVEGHCLCQCEYCGRWSALEQASGPLEPYTRLRPSELSQ